MTNDIYRLKEAFSAPVPSLRIPFLKNGDIDYRGYEKIVNHLIVAGAKSLMLTAGDSLFSVLSDAEIAEITKRTVEYAENQAVICAATGYWDTARCVEFSKYCRSLGVDILMVLPHDWGCSCTVETMKEHYSAVAPIIPVMVVTNIFIPRGAEFGLQVIKSLLDVENIIAVKDDMCNEFARKMTQMVHDKWIVLAGGQKQNHLDIHPYGCAGYLSTLVYFQPEITRRYWDAIKSNDIPAAVQIISEIDNPYFDFVSQLPGNFDAGFHGALEIGGLAQRWRRKPYYSLNNKQMESLEKFLSEKGIR